LDFAKIDVILDHLLVPTSFAAGTPENVGDIPKYHTPAPK
jgi:hypothetical protein